MTAEISLNVLITGASGLLGRAVLEYFLDEKLQEKYPSQDGPETTKFKWNCLGLCYSRPRANLRACDLNDAEQVEKVVAEFKPDAIVHCAAERRVANVENNYEKALQVNAGATEFLANLCAKSNILFIYISTDYVFDGTKPPYKISDQTNPLNKYGITKLKGEECTSKSSDKHCIVRVPVLYGRTEPNRFDESAINYLIEDVRKTDKQFKVDNFQIRYPTHCLDVARFLMQVIKRHRLSQISEPTGGENPIKGIFHCSASQKFTKYEVCCLMADLYGLPKSHIVPDLSAALDTEVKPGMRPNNCQMDTDDSNSLLKFKPVLEFKNEIKDCLENFIQI